MIEIVMDKERNLKNLKQIGTPREDNKIYIENMAYSKIREASYQDKRVFVLMGHTERMEGRYATFIEAVIPVREAEFSGNTPQWSNSMWSQVFREIKRIYEDMIIVGWAVDIRGMAPSMTPELERVHREHFGGVHQVMMLCDSLEKEETFYIYKENKLVPKDGFYIYYRARKNDDKPRQEARTQSEGFRVIDFNKEEEEESPLSSVDLDIDPTKRETLRGGRYRQMMQQKVREPESSNAGLAIAVAMLVFVLAVGVYENRESILGSQGNYSTEADATDSQKSEGGTQVDAVDTQQPQEGTQVDATDTQHSQADTETDVVASEGTEADAALTTESTQAGYEIPVEVIPGTEN